MIADAVVIVADWLADGTHGVAALLASVPKDFGWPTPSTPTIYNETQHPEVARGQVPDTLPALIVTSDPQAFTSSAPSVRPYPGDVFVTLQVRYAIANGETDEGVVDTSVMLRAIRKSLGRLVTVGEGARVRNEVQVLSWRDERAEQYQPNTDSTVTATLTITLQVRDVWVAGT
jgi:hypothetical protein